MGKVFVVGSINEDRVCFVDRRPRAGETVSAALVTRSGGKGANQAVAAAASGATVCMLGRVGADPAGRAQRDDLARRGVDVSLVTEMPGVPTGSAFVMVTPDGENAVVIAPGANALVHAPDVAAVAERISDCAVLVTQLEIPIDAVVEAIDRCGPNTRVVLNAAPFLPLPSTTLQRVDTLVVNENEAEPFVGRPPKGISGAREIATAMLGHGPRHVVLTVGAGGAVVASAGSCLHIPAPSVSAVDTTGAGDVFVGTLAALLAQRHSLHRAVSAAVDSASASVAFSGERPPLAI